MADGWQDSYVAEQIRLWRRNLGNYPYEYLPVELRKEIFDYFFRNDLYGELNQSDITRLSKGTNDLNYFRPPAVVNIALEVANKNNWFGYSDSLGHINTRISISKLEQYRRNKIQIDIENTAVVQGGTAGLHAVLTMIRDINRKKFVWLYYQHILQYLTMLHVFLN